MTPQETDTRVADRLWADYARTHDPRTREALIHQFERLAYSIANRFAQRGVESDDLCQVARLGLVKAVDRFDPSTSYRFSTFATPTILGEIKRYFRDHSRPLHVPRGIQELASEVERCSRNLTQHLHRVPSPTEIADALGVTEERVLQALALEEVSRPMSLEAESGSGKAGEALRPVEQRVGSDDAGLRRAEHQVCVQQVLRQLSEPLQCVIRLRYLAELSQREVARRLGLSQMQVSRMEKRALNQLRGQVAVN